MRSTGLLLLAGFGACTGWWLIITGWRQPRRRLVHQIEQLQRTERIAPTVPAGGHRDPVRAIGSAVLRPDVRDRLARWVEPLRLIGRPLEVHVGLLVSAAFIGLVAPALLFALAATLGVVTPGAAIPAAASLLGAIATAAWVHADAMTRAAQVRVDVRHQLAAYLDMVTMLLAGNSGHEGALEHAAQAGDGLLFRELRRRMREVATTGTSLVGALSLVAADFGLVELEQVAAATALSAAEGAPVARTLAAKCATLRSTLAGEEETAARIRNDKVTPPLVGMALLFMALIIYPALNLR